MQFANPYAWVLILSTVLLLAIAPVIWRRRRAPGSIPALAFISVVTVWSLTYAFELFNTQLEHILFWVSFEYVGIVTVPTIWLIFALEYTGQIRHFRRWLPLLVIEPVLALALAWTSSLHNLMSFQPITFLSDGWVLMYYQARGPVFWINSAYSYVLMAIATVLMLQTTFRAQKLYRGQTIPLIIGALMPWLANFLYLMGYTPVDFTPMGFSFSGLALALSLTRFDLFTVIPVARDLLFERMDDGVVMLDHSGVVVDANRAAHGLLVTETMPRSSLALNPWNGIPGWLIGGKCDKVFTRWPDLLKVIALGEGFAELNLGSEIRPHWYEVRVSTLRSRLNRLAGIGRPSGQLLIFHDIQLRKQAEDLMAEARDQAVQSSELKSQIIASVSHDLRTPLNAILGYGDMLLDGIFDPLRPQQSEVVKQMLLSAHQVNLFISDLLDQSLLERSKLSLNITTFAPQDMVSLIQSLNVPFSSQRGIDLVFELDESLPALLDGDQRRLQQVLMNLVGNAIKFTEQGTVRVRLFTPDDAHWAMEVSDTGCGIPQSAYAYIFEPYRQVPGSHQSRKGGLGLGLSIVQNLVKRMDGIIELESEVGLGSTFRVILPLVPPDLLPPPDTAVISNQTLAKDEGVA